MALNDPYPFERTPHLVTLVAEVERLAAEVREADPDDAVATHLRRDATVATLRLDGSTIPHPPDGDDLALVADADEVAAHDVPADARGTWADAIRSRSDLAVEDTRVWALEFAGATAGLAADDLADALSDDVVTTLATLHGRVVRGLVAPDVVARPRRTEQAVHDTSTGRVVYFAVPPDEVVGQLHVLANWLTSAASREHALLTSGVAHAELLRIHPYEAANGRTARTAARLLLRAAGLDPHALAVAETAMLDDPMGPYEEIARTRRRRDHTVWLERWGEAVTDGLRRAALATGRLDVHVDDDARAFVASRPRFTVADHRAVRGLSGSAAARDLAALLDAGLVRREPGTRGLRFRATSAV